MSSRKAGELRKYEMIVIFNSFNGDAHVKTEIQKVQELLDNHKARNLEVDGPSRKELAYPIKNQRFGAFVAYRFEHDDGLVIAKISQILRITDSVLRFQTHFITDKKRKIKLPIRQPRGENGEEESFIAEIEE